MTTDWIIAISTLILAIATLLLAALASASTIRDYLAGLFSRPKLFFLPLFHHVVPLQRFEQTGEVTVVAKAHYFRIGIYNDSEVAAENVEVIVSEVRTEHPDGHYKRSSTIATQYNLNWTHKFDSAYLPVLSPKTKQDITLGHIVDPRERTKFRREDNPEIISNPDETLFFLEFFVLSSKRDYLLPPGKYEIDLQLSASNIKQPVKTTVKLNHTGKWFESEEDMTSKGIGITIS